MNEYCYLKKRKGFGSDCIMAHWNGLNIKEPHIYCLLLKIPVGVEIDSKGEFENVKRPIKCKWEHPNNVLTINLGAIDVGKR